MSFLDLCERFRRLPDFPISDEDAVRELKTIGGVAARLYRNYAEEDRKCFELEWCTPKEAASPFSPANDELWYLTWQLILQTLAVALPHRMPSLSTLGASDIVEDNVFEGGRATVLSFPPRAWRQRAEHYAAGCALLAELAGEVNRRPPLNETEERLAEYIRKYPGRRGSQIAYDNSITQSHFRRVFTTKLRPHGFSNLPGNGYFPPDSLKSV